MEKNLEELQIISTRDNFNLSFFYLQRLMRLKSELADEKIVCILCQQKHENSTLHFDPTQKRLTI